MLELGTVVAAENSFYLANAVRVCCVVDHDKRDVPRTRPIPAFVRRRDPSAAFSSASLDERKSEMRSIISLRTRNLCA